MEVQSPNWSPKESPKGINLRAFSLHFSAHFVGSYLAVFWGRPWILDRFGCRFFRPPQTCSRHAFCVCNYVYVANPDAVHYEKTFFWPGDGFFWHFYPGFGGGGRSRNSGRVSISEGILLFLAFLERLATLLLDPGQTLGATTWRSTSTGTLNGGGLPKTKS